MRRWAAWVALVLVGVAASGCEDDLDWELWFSDVSPPGEPRLSSDPPEFEFVQEFGEPDEGLVFGRILGLAVSEAGVLGLLLLPAHVIPENDVVREYRLASGPEAR